MGAYLSEPIKEKQTEEGENSWIQYGASTMQGWRINQEDAHNCIADFESSTALFAVYDGHGGADVSAYTAKHFPDFLKKTEHWKDGRLGQALQDAFLEFDALLLTDEAKTELRTLAGKSEDSKSDEDPEDRGLLMEEARMPLEEILLKYGLRFKRSSGKSSASDAGAVSSQVSGKGRFLSPNLNKKKTKSVFDSNGASDANTVEISPIEHKVPNGVEAPPLPSNLDLEDEVDEEGPKTPPSSPNHTEKQEARAVKRTFSGDKKSDKNSDERSEEISVTDSVKTESLVNGGGEKLEEEALEAKRFKNADKTEEVLQNGDKEEIGDKKAQEPAEDIKSQLNVVQKIPNSKSPVPNQDDSSLNRSPQSVLQLQRNRSSKSESELKVLKMEDDTQGPVTNWKNMGHLDKEGEQATRATGTPETATAASSSGGEEESGDEDYRMDQDNAGSPDSDALDSSSSVEGKSFTSEEDEDEEESMEEGDSHEIGGIELETDEDDEDMYPVPSGDTPGVDSGTTACVAVIRSNTIYVANAGDSRAILCRAGKAKDLSVDHKPEDAEERERIEKAGGKITQDGRVNGGLNLSRAIGDHFYKKNESLPLKDQMISALPDILVETLTPQDQFMVLACDGIWNSLTSQNVVDFVKERIAKEISLSAICEQLCDHCLSPNTAGDGTGCDNMTVIILTFKRKDNGELACTDEKPPVVNGQSE